MTKLVVPVPPTVSFVIESSPAGMNSFSKVQAFPCPGSIVTSMAPPFLRPRVIPLQFASVSFQRPPLPSGRSSSMR